MAIGFKMKSAFLPHLFYSALLPSFFLGASLLYNPFDIKGYFTFGSFDYGFHLVMLSCIILLCSLLARICLYLILEKHGMQWWQYATWCLGELFVMSAFSALYTVLFKGNPGGFFAILPDCISFIFLTLVYPYIFLVLIRIIKLQNEELETKDSLADNALVRFYDEHKRLKFSVAPSALLYANSEFNYVKIYYLDAGKVKSYLLRASMKSLEGVNSKCLVRCQRSYFVNPEHVTVLRKDSEGFIFAEMNIPDIPPIPVSKQYYEAIAALL